MRHRSRDDCRIHGPWKEGGDLDRSLPAGRRSYSRGGNRKEVTHHPWGPSSPTRSGKNGKPRRIWSDLSSPGLTAEEAMEEAKRCLQCGGCSECMECVKACEAKAIHHEMKDEHLEIEVGSIILSPGFDEFQASLKT